MVTPVRVLSDNGPVRVELAHWRDQLVVVKRLQAFSSGFQERLKREAEVVKKLRHDNIIPLLATEGEHIIYAYCSGMTLEEALRGGVLKPRQAVRIISDVLRALEYAHEVGVIHFDVKPSNILVKGDKAFLTDFGFAKDLELTAITGQGEFLGTPNYMAPEQFQGERTDPRSDLYGVGAVLYHMLSGTPPYGAQVLRFLTGDDRLVLVPLPEGSKPLESIVLKALSRQPEGRFRSATEMLGALQAVKF